MTTSGYSALHDEKFDFCFKISMIYLTRLCDFNGAIYNKEFVNDFLAVCSSGKALMCCYAIQVRSKAVVITRSNCLKRYNIGGKKLKVIQDWVKNPWWS